MLKDYDMDVHYHQSKTNVVADASSWMSMGSITPVEDGKKELVKYIHRLDRLGVRFVDSTGGGVSVRPTSKSSLVVEVKEGHHFYHMLMELKGSVLVKMNDSFDLEMTAYLGPRIGYVYQMLMICGLGSL